MSEENLSSDVDHLVTSKASSLNFIFLSMLCDQH